MNKDKKSGFGYDSVIGRFRRFISETWAEMGRCSWPTRKELLESTVLVVVSIFVLACFVAGVDEVARILIRFVTVRG